MRGRNADWISNGCVYSQPLRNLSALCVSFRPLSPQRNAGEYEESD